jgi:Ca-activated chloride channel family protein
MIVKLVVLVFLLADPGDIGKINSTKSEAKTAYLAGDFKTAAEKYQYLVDSAGVVEDEVLMNLANSYFSLNDTTQAIGSYQRLTQSANNKIRSRAHQQIGVLNNREGKFGEALASLKLALKADPANNDARFNYEMIRKKLDEEKKKQEQDQNKDNKDKNEEKKDEQNKDSKDEQNKDQKDQKNTDQKNEQEKKDQEQKDKEQQEKEQQEQQEKDSKEIPPSVKDKLKEMNMSEEKAKMILEAMKNQEIQYLQQNKRKGSKPRDKNKPDW